MSQEPKTIATFVSAEEAQLAANALENAGIKSYLEEANVPGALGLAGSLMCEVNLCVAEADQQRAIEVLAQEKAAPKGPSDATWRCPKCGADVPLGFELCWSCEAPTDGAS